MMIFRKYLLFFILMLLCWACANDVEMVIKEDADFYPVRVGLFFIYDVAETKYLPVEGKKDFTYQLKLVVTDSFQNTAGGITHVVQRLTRTGSATTFDYLDTWSVRKEASQVVVNEENIAFVKLAFPLVTGKEWNGNAFNTLGGEETCGQVTTFSCDLYRVEREAVPFELNGETLIETIEVVQNNNVDLIVKQDVRKEIYARNVGMVYKESTILNYCTVGACIGKQEIESGFIFKQTLVSYGKE